MIDVGSPHALEPLRQSWLRRRKRLAVLAGLLIVGAWFGLLTTTVQQETGVSIFGQDGSRVNLQTPGGQRQAAENVPVTVAVSPGRVVRSPEPLEESSIPRPERPPPQFLPPELFRINWLFVLLNIVLPISIAAYALRRWLAASRLRAGELNFGVHKGAMPLEMHAAAGRRVERVVPTVVSWVVAAREESR